MTGRGYFYDIYEHPLQLTDMIDTTTFRHWQVDKDVAFTSDSRFFLTERDGVPTLVDSRMNWDLQKYDIDGEEMTAATFSPDDTQLYIATKEERIYIFDSQLPYSKVDGWEVYP